MFILFCIYMYDAVVNLKLKQSRLYYQALKGNLALSTELIT